MGVVDKSILGKKTDLSSRVPYTGATGDVNLGSQNLTTTGKVSSGTWEVGTSGVNSASWYYETITQYGIKYPVLVPRLTSGGGTTEYSGAIRARYFSILSDSGEANFRLSNQANTQSYTFTFKDATDALVISSIGKTSPLIDFSAIPITTTGAFGAGAITGTSLALGGGAITNATNTNWDAAYTHSTDNTQAHSDYLLNNADDTTTYKLTMGEAQIDNININNETITSNTNSLNLYHSKQHTTRGETGISIISHNPGGGMDYAGDVNIGVTIDPCYGGGSVNIFSQGGYGDGYNSVNIIAKAGNGFKGGEIHLYSEDTYGYGVSNIYLQEDGGDVVIGTGGPTGCKIGVQGDDGGASNLSPGVVKFLGGRAASTHGGGYDGDDTTIEATKGGNSTGGDGNGGKGGDVIFNAGKGGAKTGTGIAGAHGKNVFDGESHIKDEEVLSGDIVVNGAFSADTNWTKGTGWSIADGVAKHQANGTGLLTPTSSLTIKAKRFYKVTYTVASRKTGFVRFSLGGYNAPYKSANGTYTEYAFTSTTGNLTFDCSNTTRLNIDNVSVQEVIGGDLYVHNDLKVYGDIIVGDTTLTEQNIIDLLDLL